MLMVQHWGDRGLEAVRNFEKAEKRNLSIHTFRKLNQVADPEFLEPVLTAMRSSRTSVGMFATALGKACRQQWYTWHVMHPELNVHPERSM